MTVPELSFALGRPLGWLLWPGPMGRRGFAPGQLEGGWRVQLGSDIENG